MDGSGLLTRVWINGQCAQKFPGSILHDHQAGVIAIRIWERANCQSSDGKDRVLKKRLVIADQKNVELYFQGCNRCDVSEWQEDFKPSGNAWRPRLCYRQHKLDKMNLQLY